MMKHFKTPKGTQLPLRDFRGQDYLDVKWRLVWFREEHPTWGIETEVVALTETHAIFKASVRMDTGAVVATAHKREDKAHFADFAEKAETGAIGRALANSGFGTQFAEELEEDQSRVVDAPVERKQQPVAQASAPQGKPDAAPSLISDAQRKLLFARTKEAAMGEPDVKAVIGKFGYESTAAIQKKDFNRILEAVSQWKRPA